MVWSKSVSNLTQGDLDALIEEEVREGKRIDYKLKLHGGSVGDKKEFLADVVSFANSAGGYILYGVEEKRDSAGKPTGKPENLVGLTDLNVDDIALRLRQSIEHGVAPRIQGIEIDAVGEFSKGPVLVLRIPRSWDGPHMVSFSGASRFHKRDGEGKGQMDVREIGNAFLQRRGLMARIRDFHEERRSNIVNGHYDGLPIQIPFGLLHLIPVAAISEDMEPLELSKINESLEMMRPLHAGDFGTRLNIDGYIRTGSNSYLQAFRSGILEIGSSAFTYVSEGGKRFFPNRSARDVIESVADSLNYLKRVGVTLPISIHMSFIGVRGYTISWESNRKLVGHPIDRDILMLPDVLVESFDENPKIIMRPILDALWNAAGWDCCEYYYGAIQL